MIPRGLTISETARQARVNVETVRFYERQGLIPEPPRDAGGRRFYSTDAVERIQFIRLAKESGFSLPEIRELIDLEISRDRPHHEGREAFDTAMKKLDRKIEALAQIRVTLERWHANNLPQEPGRRG